MSITGIDPRRGSSGSAAATLDALTDAAISSAAVGDIIRRNPANTLFVNVAASYLDAKADFGATGDGTTDDTTALAVALTASSAAKRPLVIPPGTYKVTSTLLPGSDTVIVGYGAKLSTFIAGLGNAGAPAPTINLTGGISNVAIYGLEIDGRKSSFSSTQYKHGINLDGATNVYLEDVYCHDCKGDGIAINDMGVGVHNRHITVLHSRFNSNFRGGASVEDGQHVLFAHCEMRLNAGISPMFGVDIEPDRENSVVEDVEVRDCDCSDNGSAGDGAGINVTLKAPITGQIATGGSTTTIIKAAAGWTTDAYKDAIARVTSGNAQGEERIISGNTSTTLTVSPAFDGGAVANTDTFEIVPRQRDIRIIDCRSYGNIIHGILLYVARSVLIDDCSVRNNGSRGIEVRGNAENVTIRSCRLRDNVSDGVYLGQSGKTLSNLRVMNCDLYGGHDGGDGIEFDSGATIADVLLQGNYVDTNFRYGLKAAGTLTGLRLVGNKFNGYTAKSNGLTAAMCVPNSVLNVVIGDGTNAIATGVVGGADCKIPYDCFPLGWEIVADASGSVAVDVWADAFANWPPTVADTVAGSEKPTLSSAQTASDSTITTWSHLTGGYWLRFNVDSATTVKRVTIALAVAQLG